MKIVQIPVLSDNYAHLLIDEATGAAAAIDPAEPEPVIAAIEAAGAELRAVLCTHHHYDHAGGNEAMIRRYPRAEVVGSAQDAARIPAITRRVSDGDTITVGGLSGRVLLVPCHTRGHVGYLFGDALFSGDTLFVAGCGRFFEGDAAQMHHALNEVFAALPGNTRVFCGHEYTVSNLRFARTVDPDNAELARKLARAEAERAAGRSTVPSTIAEELATNPFMRVHTPALQEATGEEDPVAVMAAVRRLKDGFRG